MMKQSATQSIAIPDGIKKIIIISQLDNELPPVQLDRLNMCGI